MDYARLDRIAARQSRYRTKDTTVTVLVALGLIAGLLALILT